MATATKKPSPTPPKSPKSKSNPPKRGLGGMFLVVADSIFRFLASLKLAIICLSTLAVVLAYGTVFERDHGNEALQEYFYRTWWFGLLLAFLGMNILCAALSRFPWKKRQTGFVVTHAGLLVLLVGSWVSFQVGDEGQLGMVEGDWSQTLVRIGHHRVRVQELDPRTQEPKGYEYAFTLRPGVFPWDEGRYEVLTEGEDEIPFKVAVKNFMPASAGMMQYEPVERGGRPMIRLSMLVKTPQSSVPMDPFEEDFAEQQRWVIADELLSRRVKDIAMGVARINFQQLGRQNQASKIEDFLNLPDEGKQASAVLRYKDNAGQDRVVSFLPHDEEWITEDGETHGGRVFTLPDSDLKVSYLTHGNMNDPALYRKLRASIKVGDESGIEGLIKLALFIMEQSGDEELPIIEFAIQDGDGPELLHWGWPMPTFPSLMPDARNPDARERFDSLVDISYYHPAQFSEGMMGLKGVIDILGTEDGRLYYRAFNREGLQNKGRLTKGEMVQAFGGDDPGQQPMSITFSVDEYLTSGRPSSTFVPIEMPVGQAGQGIAATKVELTVDGETQEEWVRLFPMANLKPNEREVRLFQFADRTFRVWYDYDRKQLPFEIELVDFRRRFDPGTPQPSSYESDVLLTDEEKGIKEQKVTISMNEPLTHRGYTFYQASFDPPRDGSGQFISIFQVRYDPTWGIIYFGCLMIVMGVFLQFYMRAGVFTDGGKREREWAARKAAKKEGRDLTQAERDSFQTPREASEPDEPL